MQKKTPSKLVPYAKNQNSLSKRGNIKSIKPSKLLNVSRDIINIKLILKIRERKYLCHILKKGTMFKYIIDNKS